ncbi:ATP-binding protein [Pseudomonas aeruginosa]
MAPDLLILDEVGVQYGKEAELVTLFDVMNARYSACKPSIVLSNLTLEEIEVFLGQRVMDRLRENGGRAVSFNWESERAKR